MKRICEVFRAKFRQEDESPETKELNDCECYANCIASLHMILSCIILAAKASSHLSHSIQYILLSTEVLVLIIESRIRKFEIARELVSLDNSNTTFDNCMTHFPNSVSIAAYHDLQFL